MVLSTASKGCEEQNAGAQPFFFILGAGPWALGRALGPASGGRVDFKNLRGRLRDIYFNAGIAQR